MTIGQRWQERAEMVVSFNINTAIVLLSFHSFMVCLTVLSVSQFFYRVKAGGSVDNVWKDHRRKRFVCEGLR